MKNLLLALARSLAITVFISALVGSVAYFTGHSFWLWTVGTFVVQFTAFYLFNTFIEYKIARDTRGFILKEAQILAQNTMNVECASCKKESEVIVRTDSENKFICGHCNTKNSIYLFAETAVVTEPMYDQEPIPNTNSTNGINPTNGN